MDREPLSPLAGTFESDPFVERLRRRRRVLAAGGIFLAIGLAVTGVFVLHPWEPPRVLHVWGHDYTATGKDCIDGGLCPAPHAADPISLDVAKAEAGRLYQDPVVLHLLPGPPGWYGLTDAGPKPQTMVFVVFLAVGPDSFIPYRMVFCCEPTW